MRKKAIQKLTLIGLVFLLLYVFKCPINLFIYSIYFVFGSAFFSSDKINNRYKYVVATILVVFIAILLCFLNSSDKYYIIACSVGIAIRVFIKKLTKSWKYKSNRPC